MIENTHRKLSAFLATDVVGCSRLMGEYEAGTLDAFQDCTCTMEVVDPLEPTAM